MAKKGQKFKRYSTELKSEVVRKYFEEYVPAKALGEEYGVPTNTVENWVGKGNTDKSRCVEAGYSPKAKIFSLVAYKRA